MKHGTTICSVVTKGNMATKQAKSHEGTAYDIGMQLLSYPNLHMIVNSPFNLSSLLVTYKLISYSLLTFPLK